MLELFGLLALISGVLYLSQRVIRKKTANKALIWQFGAYTAYRPGIKNNANWEDEPDIVEYTDYKYWIRLRPNPGVNLPVFGYWSKAKGRKGP
jgi:hypothetical protein